MILSPTSSCSSPPSHYFYFLFLHVLFSCLSHISIVWDPKIGVSDAGLDSPAAVFLPSVALFALLVLFL